MIFFIRFWGERSSWVRFPSPSCCLGNLNPQHSEVWGERPNSTTVDILLVRTEGRQRDIHMPLDTALEYRVSIDVNKSQVKGKSDARIKKRDSSQVKEPHPDPATNPELFG
ncbi:unnamed protein product [Prunus armeniaca]|uniref:Uncharacterized protein n=1 Tax=Prunus armeniaca TaxID=36596 RepID=A0A6J5VD82_PRUAR|nr:unnamed protein product [Prunus armeniaca]CAB4286191.1 unnamed protein product [Prunus armeniaca]CAB4302809.1 unnamed protein product [Prunus armeniaca]